MRKPQAQEAVQLCCEATTGWSGQSSPLRRNSLQSSHLAAKARVILRDINHGVGQRAGDFMAASCMHGIEHCIIQFVGQHRLSTTFFGSFAFFSVTLLTGLCAGSPVDTVCAGFACGLSAICLISVILYVIVIAKHCITNRLISLQQEFSMLCLG